MTIQEQLRDEADAYERAADINFTDHEWPEDSPHVRGNLSSAARMRAAADRIDALEAALVDLIAVEPPSDRMPKTVAAMYEKARRVLESS